MAHLTPLADAVTIIRKRPEMYFGPRRPSPEAIADHLVLEALVLGAKSVQVLRIEPWWLVVADVDWMTAPCRVPTTIEHTFGALVALPEMGDNCNRGEVYVSAFASSWYIATPENSA